MPRDVYDGPFQDAPPSDFTGMSVDFDPITGKYRPQGRGGGAPGVSTPGWMTTTQPANISSQGASGLVPSWGIPGLETAVPGAIRSQGVSWLGSLKHAAATGGLGDWLTRHWRDLAGLGAAAFSGANSLREPAGQAQLEDLFKLAMQRSQAAGPLFDQMLTMTRRQLPTYTRGE